ncbi:bifunctional phosphopantothenoylcysteine decarboxylase/phosphopantothenate--cysteine ligase CoaBC [Frigidibacter albus]
MLAGKRILLIIGGGIAAYKALDLIRRLRERGASVSPVLTRAAEEFVTPLSVAALAGANVHRDLFDLTAEAEMGHIQAVALCRSRGGGPGDCRPDGEDGGRAGQ